MKVEAVRLCSYLLRFLRARWDERVRVRNAFLTEMLLWIFVAQARDVGECAKSSKCDDSESDGTGVVLLRSGWGRVGPSVGWDGGGGGKTVKACETESLGRVASKHSSAGVVRVAGEQCKGGIDRGKDASRSVMVEGGRCGCIDSGASYRHRHTHNHNPEFHTKR